MHGAFQPMLGATEATLPFDDVSGLECTDIFMRRRSEKRRQDLLVGSLHLVFCDPQQCQLLQHSLSQFPEYQAGARLANVCRCLRTFKVRLLES